MTPDEAALVRDIAAGGERAKHSLGVIFDVFGRRLTARLRRKYPKYRDECVEATQQVFLRLLEAIERRELRIANLDAYLWRTANNCMVDIFSTKEFVTGDVSDASNAYSEIEASTGNSSDGADICIKRALARFERESPIHCEALAMLTRGNGYSQLSAWLRKTEHATRQFIYEARKKLEAILVNECGDEYARGFVSKQT